MTEFVFHLSKQLLQNKIEQNHRFIMIHLSLTQLSNYYIR